MKGIAMRNIFAFAFALLFLSCLTVAQSATPEEIEQTLLAQPPQAIQDLSQALTDDNGVPDPIKVSFVIADLDGHRTFSYVVALYSTESVPGGFLRVFRREGTSLVVAGDQDVSRQIGGFSSQLQLIDVNNDGIPEIKINSLASNGNDEAFSLFLWTGTSLHDMIGNVTIHSDLADIDNSGVLAIVHVRDDGEGFDIFKLAGSDYHFFDVFNQDPTGFLNSAGQFVYVRSFCRQMEPNGFPLEAIRNVLRQSEKDENAGERGIVHLKFGGLKQLDGTVIPVEQIDDKTLSISPHLLPLRINIHSEHGDADDGTCSPAAGRADVEVSRMGFLASLQQLQPEAPLKAGDRVEIRLSGKLKDGTPLSALFEASILQDEEEEK